MTQENRINDYYAQELIKAKKEVLQEKQTVSNLEEICELKKKDNWIRN